MGNAMGKITPIEIDFCAGQMRYRHQHLQGRNELIAKAIGWRKGDVFNVIDTTAGLGREAFLIAALGCQVTLLERNPTISALLKAGLTKGHDQPEAAPVVARMQLIEGCAIEYLRTQVFETKPEVIYCDPMFEPRTKSAAVKKEMQLLQSVVGFDEDAAELVTLARTIATRRVVVKRAHYAPPIIAKPDLSFKARSHRFDVYLCHIK